MLPGRRRGAAVLLLGAILALTVVGIVVPHAVATITDRILPPAQPATATAQQSVDISPDAGSSVLWRLVAWLREFYVGGD